MSHANIDAYCAALTAKRQATASDAAGWCDFNDLQTAVRLNGYCYGEAFGYCVDVTYPKSAAFTGTDQSQEIQTTGLDGAAACNLALGMQVTASKVVIPFWSAAWNIISTNLVMVLVLVVIVVLVMSSRKRE
jgi:hypothetical protein